MGVKKGTRNSTTLQIVAYIRGMNVECSTAITNVCGEMMPIRGACCGVKMGWRKLTAKGVDCEVVE